MCAIHGQTVCTRASKFYVRGPWVSGMVFHYSDIRISGFGFFRIFSLYSHNIDSMFMKFGMNDLQGGTEDFHYSDIRISVFGFFGIFSIHGHNTELLTLDFKSWQPASEASHVYLRRQTAGARFL